MGTAVRRGLVFTGQFVMDGGVTTNPVRPGPVPGGHRPGGPAPSGSDGGAVPAQRTSGAPNLFDVALRGYDRHQVDERFTELGAQLSAAAEHNRALTARLADEQRRAEQAEQALRELRTGRGANQQSGAEANPTEGFGYRAERLLRLAEAEAYEIRSDAAKEAAELLERARADAEAHRHEIEQNLIIRATALDQKATEVTTALREREQAAAAELTSARTEAETVRAAARHEMHQARKNVETVARDIRAQAERWAEEHRAAASQEVTRLVGLKESLHRELTAVSENLMAGVRPAERPSPDGSDGGPDAQRPDRPS
jgi:cell division septum initiation protein DivIVA